ncbi:acetylserotonin O-methyltransferase [Nematostella vectensis]|uniref:acetylserotonin O-methyltransferase n=1 Tax=Nematostella vectensis TaxID=45351 RepID=UPI002076DC51|nr:acetylserotonin O-methyltransferase [Nematostella vectensis]
MDGTSIQETKQHPQLPKEFVERVFLGFASTQALFAACKLKIFDSLHEQPNSASGLREKLSTDTHLMGLTMLLDTLVSLQLLHKDTSVVPNQYENTPAADRFLVTTSKHSFTGFVKFFMTQVQPRLTTDNLVRAIQEEETVIGETWKVLYQTKEDILVFHEGFDHLMSIEAPTLLSAFDLGGFTHICDLGGGTGRLAYEASQLYPDKKLTVFELPQVVDVADQFKPCADDYPNRDHVSFIGGDLFTDDLPKADLFTIVRIVHDWGEEKSDLLLGKIFRTLPSGGGVLLGEILLPEDKTGHITGNLMSMLMLAFADSGSRERTAQEYKELFQKHGFVNVQARTTDAAFCDAVLAIKP